MAKARPIPAVGEEDRFATVAAAVVEIRGREVLEHSAGVLDLADVERLHDMRVACRRLRAALEVFEPCFPRKRFKAVLRDVKQLTDDLGERRDRDVTLQDLDRFAEGLASADQPGVRSLADVIRDEQAEANRRLAAAVTTERLTELAGRLAELVAAARPAGHGAQANGSGPR
jgi:CHAD domain-containing protein